MDESDTDEATPMREVLDLIEAGASADDLVQWAIRADIPLPPV